MKFKSTLLLSVILHISLAVLFMIPPTRKSSGEMTYYVDLVQLGGGGGGGSGKGGGGGSGKAAGTLKQETPTQAALIEEKGGGVKNLTVEKKFQSPLRFPDKESKKTVEDNKMISVVRKERTIAKSETPIQGTVIDQGLKTGISSGGGGGSGDGNGWGSGPGGPGGYFPHAYYIDLLRNRISSSWYSSLVAPGLKGKHITGVYFIVRRNGEISDLRVEHPSGVSSLDLSARRAIENAAPFAPLPNDFSSQYLVVHFEFEWEK
ncbi:MAG: TonB C-terminal domain-containing protein [Candidatus Aminicenantes bacterium]|nr:TonB C-terminal domain-containing protein [Acidobacteriota bacterium]MCG2810861.1 TonB C-terminal domain-containing protein [Candidatus Aminicenantes bacterium]